MTGEDLAFWFWWFECVSLGVSALCLRDLWRAQ